MWPFAMQIPAACDLLGSIIDSRHSQTNMQAGVGAFILYALSLSESLIKEALFLKTFLHLMYTDPREMGSHRVGG